MVAHAADNAGHAVCGRCKQGCGAADVRHDRLQFPGAVLRGVRFDHAIPVHARHGVDSLYFPETGAPFGAGSVSGRLDSFFRNSPRFCHHTAKRSFFHGAIPDFQKSALRGRHNHVPLHLRSNHESASVWLAAAILPAAALHDPGRGTGLPGEVRSGVRAVHERNASVSRAVNGGTASKTMGKWRHTNIIFTDIAPPERSPRDVSVVILSVVGLLSIWMIAPDKAGRWIPIVLVALLAYAFLRKAAQATHIALLSLLWVSACFIPKCSWISRIGPESISVSETGCIPC